MPPFVTKICHRMTYHLKSFIFVLRNSFYFHLFQSYSSSQLHKSFCIKTLIYCSIITSTPKFNVFCIYLCSSLIQSLNFENIRRTNLQNVLKLSLYQIENCYRVTILHTVYKQLHSFVRSKS